MASSSLKISPLTEVKLEVSSDIMNHPLGFVFDAGGSLVKLVYRSKEDYKNGQPLKEMKHGILRMKSFAMENGFPILLQHISDNVDMNLTEKHAEVEWRFTGLNTQNIQAKLQERFNIKINIASEFVILSKFLENYNKAKVVLHSSSFWKEEVETMNNAETAEEDRITDPMLLQAKLRSNQKINVERCIKAPECIVSPSLLLTLGSASFLQLIKEDYSNEVIDVYPAGGKSISGLLEEMFHEKSFEKLLEMMEKGDSCKVDFYARDMSVEELKDNDCYNNYPKDLLLQQLGKATSNNRNGKGEYSRADMAAGVFSMMLYNIAKWFSMQALLYKNYDLYVCGSFFQYAYVRDVFERHFISFIKQSYYPSGKIFKLHFFDNPGYLMSLGLWMKNVQEEKDRETLTPLSKI